MRSVHILRAASSDDQYQLVNFAKGVDAEWRNLPEDCPWFAAFWRTAVASDSVTPYSAPFLLCVLIGFPCSLHLSSPPHPQTIVQRFSIWARGRNTWGDLKVQMPRTYPRPIKLECWATGLKHVLEKAPHTRFSCSQVWKQLVKRHYWEFPSFGRNC